MFVHENVGLRWVLLHNTSEKNTRNKSTTTKNPPTSLLSKKKKHFLARSIPLQQGFNFPARPDAFAHGTHRLIRNPALPCIRMSLQPGACRILERRKFEPSGQITIPSLKLTCRTLKWMVGIGLFPFGALPIFRGELLSSGSVISKPECFGDFGDTSLTFSPHFGMTTRRYNLPSNHFSTLRENPGLKPFNF